MKKIIFTFFILISFLSHSQNLYDIDSVRCLKIYTYDINWIEILKRNKINNSSNRILVKLKIADITIDSVGMKFKGNSSFNTFFMKNSLNIKIDYINKNNNLWGYKTLKLSNIFRDPSAIREVLAYKIIGKYIPSPKANFVEVYINDELYGLYSNIQAVDKDFLKQNYSYKNSAFFKCEYSNKKNNINNQCNTNIYDGLTISFTTDSICYENHYELKSKSGWNELIRLMLILWYNNDDKSEYFNKLPEILDIDRVIWMLAFNNLFVNLDSYTWSGRNYYIASDTKGIFHPIMWDLNMCFGGFSHFYSYTLLPEFPVFANIDNIYRPLISKILLVQEYRKKYIEYYKELINNELINNKFEEEAKRLQNLIKPYIERDPYFYYNKIQFKNSLNNRIEDIPGIVDLMKKRLFYLKKQNEFIDFFKKYKIKDSTFIDSSCSLIKSKLSNNNSYMSNILNKNLSSEEKFIMLEKGTERPFTGKYYNNFEKGVYICKNCKAKLFTSDSKFDSGCGWPSFDDEIKGNVKRLLDSDGIRTEIQCNNCGIHLGHVFEGEGFTSKNIRHCVNSASIEFVPENNFTEIAYFAGGCFWGVEHHFINQKGVYYTEVGYMGGKTENPTYNEVCNNNTGHAEILKVVFNNQEVSYETLCRLFFEIHDPTQIDGQGPDIGEQYRSEIFFLNENQEKTALKLIEILKNKGYKVVTKITPAQKFWKAEEYHQKYYLKKGSEPYCHIYQKKF